MNRSEKFLLKRRVAQRELWRRLCSTPDFPLKVFFIVLYLLGLIYAWGKQDDAVAFTDRLVLPSPVIEGICHNLVTVYLLAGGIGLIVLLVYPFGRKDAEDQLRSIGLTNHTDMAPLLLRRRQDKEHPHVTVWEFNNRSIPLDTWEAKQTAIEAALDVTIVKMKYGRSKSRVLLYAVPARTDLPEVIEWRDSYLSLDSFVLALGESYMGPVTVNLAKIPHVLLGGSTGSGKSVLLKLLLMQSLRKGAKVYIADFKGGVDFPPVWHKRCRMCFDEQDLIELLTGLVDELQRRQRLLVDAGYPNIDEYNKATGKRLQRLILACDEVAEVLDKTGADSERKKLLAQIESKLSTIARRGRALGIHLILATQRPDAQLIPGQIRNNLDCRICGRADKVLADLIMDSTEAADRIPKDARGRFILHDGTIFQGYLFDVKSSLEGSGGNRIRL